MLGTPCNPLIWRVDEALFPSCSAAGAARETGGQGLRRLDGRALLAENASGATEVCLLSNHLMRKDRGGIGLSSCSRAAILFFCVLLGISLFSQGTRAAAAPAPPATTELAAQINQLADPDPKVREQATTSLWLAGAAAEPLLKQAAGDDDPEIAERARTILHNISYGLLPDTPRQVIELLDEYLEQRKASDLGQCSSIVGRLSNQGPKGVRVLLALRRDEGDESYQHLLLGALTPHAHEGAQGLIAAGLVDDAQTLLNAVAPITESAARDYAALLARGTLAPKLAAVKAEARSDAGKGKFLELLYLARAAGDLDLAKWAAKQIDRADLLDQVLIEQEDWKELASRYRGKIGDSDSIESLGFAAAFCRLTGDEVGLNAAAAVIKSHATSKPDDLGKAVEILCLNDHPQEAIDLLVNHREYLRAFDYLLPRMEYRRAMDLLQTARAQRYALLPQLQARSALALRFMGKVTDAHKTLDELENGRRPDVSTWCEMIDARREIDGAAAAEALLVKVLSEVHGEAAAEILAKAGFPDAFPASYWWEFLRRQNPKDDPQQSWKTLSAMAANHLPPQELEQLAETARVEAMRIVSPSVMRDDALHNIAQTLLIAGRSESAEKCFRVLADSSSNADALQRVGDCQAARGDWAGAAETYRASWERDRTRPVPLALRAAALMKLGDARQARELLDLSHLLPLGNETLRVELAEAMQRTDLPDDAARERTIVTATGALMSWGVCHLVRERGDQAAGSGDYSTAVRFWERAFLQNIKFNINFQDAWANVAVPALVHRTRAQAAIAAGDWATALAEAQRSRDDSPGDADAMIQIVTDLGTHGRKHEADQLFASTLASYQKQSAEYPDSGPMENLLAWFSGKCGRNLDEALKRATRATQLEPTNTASLDTLAEVHFRRGQIKEAIADIRHCIELEPNDPHHRKQLERFENAEQKQITDPR
jgi:tetratricopeptide (TPR) repeat protein